MIEKIETEEENQDKDFILVDDLGEVVVDDVEITVPSYIAEENGAIEENTHEEG